MDFFEQENENDFIKGNNMNIKDIAAKCGVSVTTVSRVINNHPYVKDEVRANVLRVMEEERFVPHNGAAELVRRQSDTIGIIARGMGNPFFARIINYLESEVSAIGYTSLTKQITTADDELREAALFAKEKKLRGLIFLGGRFDWTDEDAIILNIPYVCCTFCKRFGAEDSIRISSVGIDDKKEAYRAVKLLIDNGHDRIAIVLPSKDDHSVSQLRYEGYCQALRDAGIKLDPKLVRETGDYKLEEAYYNATKLVKDGTDFTALFVISDYMAIATIKALSDCGKRVPDDVSIISIDGIELSQYTIPTLSTLEQPSEAIAKSTVNILKQMIEEDMEIVQVYMGALFREGNTIRSI